MEPKLDGSGQSILRAAGLMSVATFLSRIMGLIREQAIAILFGAGNATDAYLMAFRIPNLLRDLFAEGAMSASLVPTFTRARSEEGDRRAWRVAGLVFRVLFTVVGLLAALGIVFAPSLVSLYASAYQSVPGKFELTVAMTRVIFPFFPMVALAAAFMGVLNACGYFFLPALSSALFNLASVIVGVGLSLAFRGTNIPPIMGMAIGVVVGGMVQAFCQLPTLYRAGYRWQPRAAADPVWHRDRALRRMLWMMVPGTIGLAATQINLLVNSILATSQGPGAVSWLSYAFRLMQFPIGIFGVSLATATLPRISQQWVDRDVSAVRATLTQSLRQILAINLPASAGLAFLSFPIIRLIFQYGRFDAVAAHHTALALAVYAGGLTAYSAVKVLVPACYALGNTRVPVLSSFVAVLFTIVLNLILVHPFGYWGLALGTSCAAVLNCVFLLFAIRGLLEKAGGTFPFAPLLRAFFVYSSVALAMGALCYFSHGWIENKFPEMPGAVSGKLVLVFHRLFRVGPVIIEGMVFMVVAAKIFRLGDLTQAIDLFENKLKKKLRWVAR